MVRGDRDVNETKLRKFLKATEVELASPSVVEEVTHAEVGFAGPIGIDCPVYADEEVKYMQNFIVGANKTGYHYCNVNLKDFKAEAFADLRNIMEGDICPNCGGRIHFAHGIEVGNTIFCGILTTGSKSAAELNIFLTCDDKESGNHERLSLRALTIVLGGLEALIGIPREAIEVETVIPVGTTNERKCVRTKIVGDMLH